MVMDKIDIKDIDFDSLKKLRFQGSLATVYKDGSECVKIFKKMKNFNVETLYDKFMRMDGIKIDGVLMPTCLIMDENGLRGYIMPYYENSVSLNRFCYYPEHMESAEILRAVKKASIILKEIHKNGIICQDLSFDNILINRNLEIAYCDMDGCWYDELRSECVSKLLKKYLFDYRGQKIIVSKNLDRLSMLLSLFQVMYLREIQKLSDKRYNYLADNLKTMENLRKYANILRDKEELIPDLPYLDDIIDDADAFVIDRNKQRNILQRKFNFNIL